jgi:hypothetical protein
MISPRAALTRQTVINQDSTPSRGHPPSTTTEIVLVKLVGS